MVSSLHGSIKPGHRGRGRPSAQAMELTHQLEMLRVVLDALPEGLEVVDRDGRICYVNAAFVRITGVPLHERDGLNILEIAPKGEIAQVLRTGKAVVGRRTRGQGSNIDVMASAVPLLANGELLGAVLIIQDISDVLRMSRDLQERIAQVEDLSMHLGNLTRAKYTFSDLVGTGRAMQDAVKLARQAAAQHSTVLLTGESGTGKELFAHAIHNASSRRGNPFVKVNCAAVPEHLLESEFFGYEKGAFTGAVGRKSGLFEVANNGTLFLDEVGDMPITLQSKLLRVLQEGEFHRLGGTTPVRVNVRIIAATNLPLAEMVAQNRFRRDLYYRLNVIAIPIAPLRDRLEDLSDLVDSVLYRLGRRLGREVDGVTAEALRVLSGYGWPGNVRELENVLERAVLTLPADCKLLDAAELPPLQRERELPREHDRICSLQEMEIELIGRTMARYGYTGEGKRRAAVALGISLATLYSKLKQYGLKNS